MIEVRQEPASVLAEYGRISIAFKIGDTVKDYDAVGVPPADWPAHFDVSRWALFVAFVDGQRVGGAAVTDRAALWDIRVLESHRRRGVGAALFRAAAAWAAAGGHRHLTIETQDNNVAACRFYARMGCALVAENRGAYPALPDEIQLMWRKDLER